MPEPVNPVDPRQVSRAALSALMDGQAGLVDAACVAWQGNAAARADWHAYHLIGDILRSDEHRADAAHDASFVARLRSRMASEPPRLMTRGKSAAPQRRTAVWMAPAAVAAGFIAVAGVLLVTRVATTEGAGGRDTLAASGGALVSSVTPPAGPATLASAPPLDIAPMIRNAELDRYLEAHRQFANASTLPAPGGVMRSAAVAAPGR